MDILNSLAIRKIVAEGNNPVLLNDVTKIWLVQEGQLDIFITGLVGEMTSGARKFLFQTSAGEVLCGLAPLPEQANYGLLAVGRTGTILLEVTRQEVVEKITGPKISELAALLQEWLKKLGPAAGIGEEAELEGAGDLNIALDKVQVLQAQAFVSIVQQLRLAQEKEVTVNKLKYRQDNQYMNNGLFNLLSSINPHLGIAAQLNQGLVDNLLFKVCQAVGTSKRIKISLPSKLKENMAAPAKDLLGDIARASQIRTREVILKDKWWLKDSGALVAYLEEDGRPVALLPLSPKKYELYDPLHEKRIVVTEQVADTLKAHAITFYRPLPNKVLKYRDILQFLYAGIWKRDLVILLLMGILGGLAGMLTPIVTGVIFDKVIPDGERLLLIQIGFLLSALALTTFAFNLTRAFAMQRLEGRTEADLQAAVWDRLLSLPVTFFKQFTAGELANRAMGISEIRDILAGMAINTVVSAIFSIFYFILLFYYNVKLALICTVIVIVVMGISLLCGYLQLRYERELIDLNNELSGRVFGLLSGISKLKMAGAEKRAFYHWTQVFSKARGISYQNEHLGNKLEVFNSTVNIIASMIIFFALIRLSDIKLGAGMFIAFNSAFGSFFGSMLSLSNVILEANVLVPLYERTKPILETLPEYDEDKADPGELLGNIEISHVNFRYEDNGPLILNDVSIRIRAGEYVALVGPSGSGKSTLFRILLGFEKPEAGQVYYDSWDLEKVDIRMVRQQMGVVLQGGQLMSGSIFENIVGATPGLTVDDAWEAARRAGMAEDIESMPMGMHTVVMEGGGTLSGGQRQRLMIARAIITNPQIVYFDEATSALDNKTQEVVSESLGNLKATRIVIAHRLSTIVNCDRIIVLDRGQVVEEGTYQELFAKGGFFTNMAKRQLA